MKMFSVQLKSYVTHPASYNLLMLVTYDTWSGALTQGPLTAILTDKWQHAMMTTKPVLNNVDICLI